MKENNPEKTIMRRHSAETAAYMPDKPGLLITGKPRPLPRAEPDKSDRVLWIRWCMATYGVSLSRAYDLLHEGI